MRKVHPGDVHPVLHHLQQRLWFLKRATTMRRAGTKSQSSTDPADWSNGADDAREPDSVGPAGDVQVGVVVDHSGGHGRLALGGRNIGHRQDRLEKQHN